MVTFEDPALQKLPLQAIQEAKELTLRGCFSLKQQEFDALQECTLITQLTIDYSNELENLNFLRHMPQLKKLVLTRISGLKDLTPLTSLINLTYLDLASSGETSIFDFSPLSSLHKLQHLDLTNMMLLRSLDFAAPLTQLTFLSLNYCHNLEDVAALEHLPHLTTLLTNGCVHSDEAIAHFLQRHNNESMRRVI